MVEVGDLLPGMEIFQQRRSALPDGQRVIGVVDTHALLRRQITAIAVTSVLVELLPLCIPVIRVGSQSGPVISATELMVQKLMVLDCHRCDFAELLLVAKILREQVDWSSVRWRTRDSPFAQAFWQLLVGLSVIGRDDTSDSTNQEPPAQYLVAGVRRALAEDPQIGELGIDIEIDHDTLRLVGPVSCSAQRAGGRDGGPTDR